MHGILSAWFFNVKKDSTRLLIRSLTVITRMSSLWPIKGSGPGGGRTHGCQCIPIGQSSCIVVKDLQRRICKKLRDFHISPPNFTVQTGFEPASRRYERCSPTRQSKIFQSVFWLNKIKRSTRLCSDISYRSTTELLRCCQQRQELNLRPVD